MKASGYYYCWKLLVSTVICFWITAIKQNWFRQKLVLGKNSRFSLIFLIFFTDYFLKILWIFNFDHLKVSIRSNLVPKTTPQVENRKLFFYYKSRTYSHTKKKQNQYIYCTAPNRKKDNINKIVFHISRIKFNIIYLIDTIITFCIL